MLPVVECALMGDLLRPDQNLRFGGDHNVKWLGDIVTPALTLDVVKIDGHYIQKNFPDYFSSIFDKRYSSYQDIATEWAHFYDADLPPMETRDLLDRMMSRIIISFETPPSILRYIEKVGGTYVDIKVSPIRFGQDLLLSFFSNSQKIFNKLRQFGIPDNFLLTEAALLERRLSQLFPKFELPSGSAVFLAQSSFDSTLISGGKLVRISDNRELIESLIAGRQCFIIPHPNEPKSVGATQFLEQFPSAQVISHNTYNVMCHAKDLHFITISSGSGSEAEVLCSHRNNAVSFISQNNMSVKGERYGKFVHVAAAFWSPVFWQAILSPETPVFAPDNFLIEPDRLRNHIGERWSKTF